MAKGLRPRSLAAGFGVYFVVIAFVAWGYAQSQGLWFPADITRWVYTTYMLVAAIFLVGLAGLGVSVRRSFTRQIHELDRRSASSRNPGSEALPPPLPETTVVRDHVDRDIDELLESLSEIEQTTAQEAAAMDMGVSEAPPMVGPRDSASAAQRERLVQKSKQLGRFVIGPGVAAALILGISGMMLPGSDGFAQYQFQLNTALILGIAYSWVGVGGYIAATVYALAGGRDERRRR